MDFTVTCSWCDQNDSKIDEVILFLDVDKDQKAQLPGKVQLLIPDKSNGNGPDPCTLKICRNLGCSYNIEAIDILCNARRMEVYSDKNEYMCTEEGTFIEVLEDNVKLYMLQKTFEPAQSESTIKLVSLQNKDELFLHSIHISVIQSPGMSLTQMMGGASIDLEKVKSMMSDTGQPLSEGAQGLLSVMETFQKNKSASSQQMGSMGMMMSMFSSMAMSKSANQTQPLPASQTQPVSSSQVKSSSASSTQPSSVITSNQENHNPTYNHKTPTPATQGNSSQTFSGINGQKHKSSSLIQNIQYNSDGTHSENDSSCLSEAKRSEPQSEIDCETELNHSENNVCPNKLESHMKSNVVINDNMSSTLDSGNNTSSSGPKSSAKLENSIEMTQFEEIIRQSIQESEKRIMAHVNNKFQDMENLINKKFDCVVNMLSKEKMGKESGSVVCERTNVSIIETDSNLELD